MRLAATLARVEIDPGRLGDEIRQERDRQGISQQALATRASSHQAVIWKIEKGEHELQFDLLCRVADALLGPNGLGLLLHRSGHLALEEISLRDRLASAPELSEHAREQMVGQYDYWVARSREEVSRNG